MSNLNKKVGAKITKDEADKLMKEWEKTGIKTKSNFFGSDIINEIMSNPDVIGLRIHHGIQDGEVKPVLTPVYADSAKSEPVYVNASLACPPLC